MATHLLGNVKYEAEDAAELKDLERMIELLDNHLHFEKAPPLEFSSLRKGKPKPQFIVSSGKRDSVCIRPVADSLPDYCVYSSGRDAGRNKILDVHNSSKYIRIGLKSSQQDNLFFYYLFPNQELYNAFQKEAK